MLAIEIYPAANKSVVVESLAQYNPIPHDPDIIKPNTVIKYMPLKYVTLS